MRTYQEGVESLPGVGPKRLTALHHLNIFTLEDLVTHYPFRYEDLAERQPDQTLDGDKVTFKGQVSTPPIVRRRGKRSQAYFGLMVGQINIRVKFFNQPWIVKNIGVGQELAVYGTYNAAKAALTAIKLVTASSDELDPIYQASKEITAKTLRQLIELGWSQIRGSLPSLVPIRIREKYRLLDRNQEVEWLHFPPDSYHAKQARRSAAFEEFYIFQMRLQLIKTADQTFAGQAIDYDEMAVANLVKRLPFILTKAQRRVADEILQDQARPIHMNRLLQGDVGSGKTVVAAIAMYAVVTAGMQAALMAPTEILAQQHAQGLAQLFDCLDVNLRVELLTSGLKVPQRRQILADLEGGEIDILIGTHALLQPDVHFHHLGLAVIDEQHRFGVKQRSRLREAGINPDILAMTATPIPRTLAITAYGEMDVSIIDELPAGRKPIITRWLQENQLDQTLGFMKDQLQAGAQAYVVTPLIAESEALDIQNAEAVHQELQTALPEFRIGLLHGRLTNEEKRQMMAAFQANQIQVLVATTVVEVGVDVANASLMLILDADRFGLAQLHQLRGRVGRGERQSYAFLIANPKTAYGRARLEAMVATTDGFELAQEDLKLRGSGDILGTKQSGIPEFKIGDPVKDLTMLSIAQQEAIATVEDPTWDQDPANQGLVNYLSQTMAQYRHFD